MSSNGLGLICGSIRFIAFEPAEEKKPVADKDLSKADTEELKDLLKKAIDDEAYERASKIRDELNKRKKR